jgi:hypothetical protein
MSLLTNLVEYWKLDESSGNAAGSVGAVTLTNNNTVGYATGKINNGADFGALNTNKYLDSSNNLGINGTSISINLWVKVDTQPTVGQFQHFFVQGHSTSKTVNFIRYYNSGGTNYVQFSRGKNDVAENEYSHAMTLTTGVWYMLTYTYDGTTIRAYINATLVGSVAASGSGTGVNAFINGVRLGRHTLTTGGDYIKGMEDEVAVWSREIILSEITALYNSGLGLPYPLGIVITTDAVTDISVTTATGGGDVTNDGGSVIVERGIVWSTTQNPTTSNFKSVTSGTTGTFTTSMTLLTPATLYYVRAFARNAFETVYGNQVEFTTGSAEPDSLYWDIDGVDGATYAVQLYVGGTTGSVTVKLGSTGTSQVINAGAGTVTLQGVYGGLNGLIIQASATFDGYVDNVYEVLVVGDATIDWSLDTLTNVFPINSSVLFRRLEDKDFNTFRVYRYLDIQFKDLDAYVTVLLKNEANEEVTEDSKEFLVSNTSTDTLPFIKKRISFLKKNQAMLIKLSNNRLSERFTICQFIIKGFNEPNRQFDGGKIINVV